MVRSLVMGIVLASIGGSVPSRDVRETAFAVPDAVPDAVPGTVPNAVRDTTFTVPAGARVVVHNPDGDIQVRGSDGRRGRARMDDEDHGVVELRRRGDSFEIRPAYGGGDMVVELPADVILEVMGSDGDISIRGFRSSVVAETFDGSIFVDGGTVVAVHSVDGDVRVRNVTTSVTVDMGDGDAHVRGVRGPVVVNAIDGELVVEDADTRSLVLNTISGDLWYSGRVHEGGDYELATHDGDVTFAIAEGIGATISVFTYDGALLPSFPIQLRGAIGSNAEFTLGNGSARVKLESFDGNIHLIRPGERSPDNR